MSPGFRIVLASSPRAGNNWLRELLAMCYGLEQVSVHAPGDLPEVLPERVVIQMHWDRTTEVEALWAGMGARVVSIARHPIDTLVSMLHFSRFEPEVARWLEGDYLRELAGCSPTSERFAAFALGAGAHHLLSVTPHWWADPGTVRLTYEGLCDEPERMLGFLLTELGEPSVVPVAKAVSRLTADAFRPLPNHHFWQGRPGLWRGLVLPDLAMRIRQAHPASFTPLGYRCDPDPTLTAERAVRAWEALRHKA
jgi:hypothetical protein